MQHLVTLFDISPTDVRRVLATALVLKQRLKKGDRPALLERRVLAMLFEKPSLRTRVSFETGIAQLGGTSLFLGEDVGWGKRESPSDFTQVLGQFVDGVVCRAKSHDRVEQLASFDALPVINSAFFRFNAHGELINEINLINYVNIAIKNPHCNFSLWTKRYDIIAKYFKNNKKPKNFILIYSTPRINHILDKIPPYFDKTFSTVPESEHQDRQNCTGQKCKDCLLCYKLDTPAVIVEKVKTYGKKKFKKAGL